MTEYDVVAGIGIGRLSQECMLLRRVQCCENIPSNEPASANCNDGLVCACPSKVVIGEARRERIGTGEEPALVEVHAQLDARLTRLDPLSAIYGPSRNPHRLQGA